VGHLQVGHQYIRRQLPGFLERFLAIGGFAQDFKTRAPGQASQEAPAHDWVVIRQEQRDSVIGLGRRAGGIRPQGIGAEAWFHGKNIWTDTDVANLFARLLASDGLPAG
jgi:hypothetical protein